MYLYCPCECHEISLHRVLESDMDTEPEQFGGLPLLARFGRTGSWAFLRLFCCDLDLHFISAMIFVHSTPMYNALPDDSPLFEKTG